MKLLIISLLTLSAFAQNNKVVNSVADTKPVKPVTVELSEKGKADFAALIEEAKKVAEFERNIEAAKVQLELMKQKNALQFKLIESEEKRLTCADCSLTTDGKLAKPVKPAEKPIAQK